MLETQIELSRGIAFDASEMNGDSARVRELRDSLRDSMNALEARPVALDTMMELLDACEELNALVRAYPAEPDAMLDVLEFYWKARLYHRGLEAGRWLEECYRQAEKAHIENPENTDIPNSEQSKKWADFINRMGVLCHSCGRGAEAERYYREALERYETLAQEPCASDAARVRNNLGVLLCGLGRTEEAERLLREALELRRKLAADSPGAPDADTSEEPVQTGESGAEDSNHQRGDSDINRNDSGEQKNNVANTCNNLGNLLSAEQRMEEAERHYREALGIYGGTGKPTPAAWEPRLAETCYNLGVLKQRKGYHATAKRYFRVALSLYEAVSGS